MPKASDRVNTSGARQMRTTWLKNATKSLGMNALEVVQSFTPNVSEIVTTSSQTSKGLIDTLRSGRMSSRQVGRMIQQNPYFRLAVTGLENIKEDLKAGNFNNTERQNQAFLGEGSDMGMNFGDFDSDDNDSSGSMNITVDNSSTGAALSEMSTRQTNAIMKSAEATINANIANTTALMQQQQEYGAKVLTSLDNITNHLAAMVSFNNENMSKFIQSSTAYFERVGSAVEEMSSSKTQMTGSDVLKTKNGGIEFSKYRELVGQQMKDFIENSSAGMVKNMVDQFGNQIVANPLNMISKLVIEKAIPDVIQETVKNLDRTIGEASVVLLNRLYNDWGNQYGNSVTSIGKRFIGRTFGLNMDRKKELFMGQKMSGKAATFDDYTYHSVTEIIPKYLRESTSYLKSIAEAVTGKDAKVMKGNADVYDYEQGYYRSVDDLRKEFYDTIQNTTTAGMRETQFGKTLIQGSKAANVDSSKYMDAMNSFLYKLTEAGSPDFSKGRESWMNQIDEILGDVDTDDITKAYLRAAVEKSWSKRKGGAGMTAAVLQGNAARNNLLKNIENNPSAYNYYAMNDSNREVDAVLSENLYGLTEDKIDQRIRNKGSLMDVLDNMNYLLERGLNVRVTGEKPYATDSNRRGKGIPKIAKIQDVPKISDTINRTIEENAKPNVDTDSINQEMDDVLSSQEKTVGGVLKGVKNRGSNAISAIYDILEGRPVEGFKKLRNSFDPRSSNIQSDANGQRESSSNEGSNDTNSTSNNSENETARQNVFKKAYDKINKILDMPADEAKKHLFDYILGEKVDTGKKDEQGNAIFTRSESPNAVIRTFSNVMQDGFSGIYESIFGEKYDKGKKQTFTGKIKDSVDKQLKKYQQYTSTEEGTHNANLAKGAAAGGLIGSVIAGPIFGGIIGSGLGMISQSNTAREFLFGKDQGIDPETGKPKGRQGGIGQYISGKWNELNEKFGFTAEIDPETGNPKKSKKLQIGITTGFLAGCFTPLGPIGGAVAGLASTIVLGRGKVHDFIFGTEKDENGNRKEIGLIGRLRNSVDAYLAEPLKQTAKDFLQDGKDFLKDALVQPFQNMLDPVITLVHNIGEDMIDSFRAKMDTVTRAVSQHLNGLVNFVQTKLFGGILGRAGSFIANRVSGARNFLSNHNPLNMIGRAANNANRNRSLKKRKEELEILAKTDPSAKEELDRLNSGDEEAIEQAMQRYGGDSYDKVIERQKAERNLHEGNKLKDRKSDKARLQRLQFVSVMSGGRLNGDTPENMKMAMEEFERQKKNHPMKKKINGFKVDYDPNEGLSDAEINDREQSAAESTSENTLHIASTAEEIQALIEKQTKIQEQLIKKMQDRRAAADEAGEEYDDSQDNSDLRDLRRSQKTLTVLKKERSAALRREGQDREMAEALNDPAVQGLKKAVGFVGKKTKGALKDLFLAGRDEIGDDPRKLLTYLQDFGREHPDQFKNIAQDLYSKMADRDEWKNDNYRVVEDSIRGYAGSNTEVSEEELARVRQLMTRAFVNRKKSYYAKGTDAAPESGWSVVGEKGPEMRWINKGDQIKPNNETIKVSIEGISEKFAQFLDKTPLGVKVIGSRGLIPAYIGGFLNPQTDAKSSILGSMENDENVNPDQVKRDMGDLSLLFGGSSGNGKKDDKDEDDEKKGFFEQLFNKDGGGIINNLKTIIMNSKAGKFLKNAGNIAKEGAGIASVVMPTIGLKYLWDQRKTNASGNVYDTDENGNVVLDENGKAKSFDDSNEKRGPLKSLLNMIAPQRTSVDAETGEVSTNREVSGKNINLGIRSIQMLKNKGLPYLGEKTLKLGQTVGKTKAGAIAIEAASKGGTALMSAAKAAIKKSGGLISSAAKTVKNSAVVQSAVNSNFVTSVKNVIQKGFTFISEKFIDLCKKMKWDKAANVVDDFVKKLMPSVTDDVIKTNQSWFSKLLAKAEGAASTVGITELIGFGIGGIAGATSPSKLFDCDYDNDNLDKITKSAMMAISILFQGLQGTTPGMVLDVLSIVWSTISGESTDFIKSLANTMLNAVIGIGSNGEQRKTNLQNAQTDFKNEYNDYIQKEYDAYKQHLSEQGKDDEIMSFEDYMSSIGTSFDDYNKEQNKNIYGKAWDAVKGIFGGNKNKQQQSTDATLSTNQTSTNTTSTPASTYNMNTSMITENKAKASTPQLNTSYLTGGSGDVPYYSQNDPRWKNADYSVSGKSTFGQSGCGPTAMAMAASGASGKNINPMQMASFAKQNGFRDSSGTNQSFIDASSKALGLSSTSERNPNQSFLNTQLSKGKPVVLLGRDGGYGGSAFTKAGHYVVATGKTKDGNVIINDPRGKKYSGAYDPKRLLGESAKAWAIGGKGEGDDATLSNTSTGTKVTADDVIKVAQNEVGYLEKKDNNNLNDKTANAGKANFTKYGEWMGTNGQAWCAAFVCWCFGTAANGNKTVAAKLLCGNLTALCASMYTQFSNAKRLTSDPKPGDIIFFKGTKRVSEHVGIVISANDSTIETIEGNTSAKNNTVIPNGEGVSKKSYQRNNDRILGFGRPYYDNESGFVGISSDASTDATQNTNGTTSTSTDGSTTNSSGGLTSILDKIWNNFGDVTTRITNKLLTGKETVDDTDTSTGTANTTNPDGSDLNTSMLADGSATIDLSNFKGSDNAETTWNFLRASGYSPAAAAGVLGNLQHESGIDPNKRQNGGGPAAGIAQWENANQNTGRFAELNKFAQSKGTAWNDLGTQLQFLNQELSGSQKYYFTKGSGLEKAGATPTTFEDWKNSNDVGMATRQFEGAFERAGKPAIDARIQYANAYYQKYKDNAVGEKSSSDTSITGGSGGYDDYEFDPMMNPEMNGGYGPDTSSTPQKATVTSFGTQQTRTNSVPVQTAGETKEQQLLRAIIEVLGTIADNTGTTSSKLDNLKTMNSMTNIQGGNTIVGTSNEKTQTQSTMSDKVNYNKAIQISKGGF